MTGSAGGVSTERFYGGSLLVLSASWPSCRTLSSGRVAGEDVAEDRAVVPLGLFTFGLSHKERSGTKRQAPELVLLLVVVPEATAILRNNGSRKEALSAES